MECERRSYNGKLTLIGQLNMKEEMKREKKFLYVFKAVTIIKIFGPNISSSFLMMMSTALKDTRR